MVRSPLGSGAGLKTGVPSRAVPSLLLGTAPRGAPCRSSGFFPFAALSRCDAGRRPALHCRVRFGRVGGTRLSRPCGPRCRPPLGELARGRRSLTGGAISATGDCAERGAVPEFGVLPFRSAVALDAGRRPALHCRVRFGRVGGTRLSRPCGPRCRRPPGELARGRRSLAGGAIPAGGDCAERGAMREFGVLPFRSAVALRCRPEVGVP